MEGSKLKSKTEAEPETITGCPSRATASSGVADVPLPVSAPNRNDRPIREADAGQSTAVGGVFFKKSGDQSERTEARILAVPLPPKPPSKFRRVGPGKG